MRCRRPAPAHWLKPPITLAAIALAARSRVSQDSTASGAAWERTIGFAVTTLLVRTTCQATLGCG